MPALRIYLSNSDGLINFSHSWVPLGKILKIYSAPTIAVTKDLAFLFKVERNIWPLGFRRSEQDLISRPGSGTCSITSKQATTSKDSFSFFTNSSAVINL